MARAGKTVIPFTMLKSHLHLHSPQFRIHRFMDSQALRVEKNPANHPDQTSWAHSNADRQWPNPLPKPGLAGEEVERRGWASTLSLGTLRGRAQETRLGSTHPPRQRLAALHTALIQLKHMHFKIRRSVHPKCASTAQKPIMVH